MTYEILKTEKKITVKDNVKITVNQNKIIQAIKENPFITQEELVQIVGISKVNINKNMKKTSGKWMYSKSCR